MIKISSTNAVSKEVFSELMRNPEHLFEMLRMDAGELAGNVISSLLKSELTSFLGVLKNNQKVQKNVDTT